MANVYDMFGMRKPLSADRHEISAAAWLNRDLPPRDYLLEDVLCTTSRWLVIGVTGIGKTLFGVDLGFAVATGANFLHWNGTGRRRRVMYIDGELPPETLKERVQASAAVYGAEADIYLYNRDVLDPGEMTAFNLEKGEHWLLRELQALKPDMVIFDNIECLCQGPMDEEHWNPVQTIIRRLSAARIAQVWLDQTGFNASRGYGTKSKEWAMDSVILLSEPEDRKGEGVIRIEYTKARLRVPATAALFAPKLIHRDPHGWTVEPLVVETKTKPGEQKKHWFLDAYDFLADGVVTEPGYTAKPVKKVGIEAIRDHMAEREWLSRENGKLPAAERTAFCRAKDALIAARIMAAKGGKIWRI
jgi:hypothetical protein